MAIDQLARGLAASAQGGGGGVVDVNIKEGVGIHVETQGDDITISNLGVTNITASDTDAEDGTVKVVFGADSSKNKNVPVKGLKAGAYKAVDTKVDTTTKDSTNVPTTKAVYDSVKSKVDSSAVGDTIATLDSTKKLPTTQLPAHNHNASEITAMTNYNIAGEASAILQTDSLNTAIGKLEKAIEGKKPGGKNYAGASTDGGAATSAEKLSNTTAIGSGTKGVYFGADGLPKAMTYELNKTVPSNAEFTDTKYTSDTNSGISVNANTKKISNTGVRSISESSNDGKIGFNLNGEDKEVQIKGFKDFILKKLETPATSYAAQYQLFSRKDNTGEYTAVADSATIDIPKDLVVESGDVKTCTVANVPVSGYKVGDKYIDLVIANTDNKHIYIPVNALVDDKADGISYSNSTSKLTATNVQAAIDEVVTKIGALDTNKLDKTAVLSDFSSSELTNKVPSAQLVLDSFTKKSATESANNNTRIITVPENVDCFGSVAMIGGKTQKTKNFYDCLKTEPYSAGKETVTTTENSVRVVMSKAGTYGASKFVYSFTVGKSYTLSADVTISSGTARLAIRTADNTVKAGTNPITANGHYTTTFTATSDMAFVSLFATWDSAITGDVTYSNIMLVEGNAEIPYEPYHADLWNAPVTAVESMGKNLFNGETISLSSLKKVGDSWINTTADTRTTYAIIGRLYNGGTALGASIPSTKFGDNIYYAKFTKTSDADSMTFGHSGAVTDLKFKFDISHLTNGEEYIISATITGAPNVANSLTFSNVMIEHSGTRTDFAPYNKTTISLDTIINNLPDYGASVSDEIYNYIDFENGVYHHRVSSVDMTDFTWTENNARWYSARIAGNIRHAASDDSPCTWILSSKYASGVAKNQLVEKTIAADDSGYIWFKDSAVTSKDSAKTAMSGVVLNYQLLNEELIPLADVLSPIHVEPNGTLEFVNEHNLDMPTKVIYKKTV